MPSSVRTSRPLISPEVDRVRLFDDVARAFAGAYEPLELIAASAERAIFVARDTVLRRRVALRVHLAADSAWRGWFERESQLLAALDHPVIRPVFAAGFQGEWAYRVSKWIDGESLAAAVNRGPRPIPSVLHLAKDLTSGLEYVHAQRIVVRRIEPETVMLEAAGRAILTDLRYANVHLDVAVPRGLDAIAEAFAAPEIRAGQSGEPWSDIYALGALLYYAVTGSVPPTDPTEIPSPRELRSTCPRALERIIGRALQAEPMQRYLTAIEMLEDLMSDLGDMDVPQIAKIEGSPSSDAEGWEKYLRRALGDDYELLRELGSGGFGRVYLVRDLALEREAALKVLHPYLTIDPAVSERFQREARTAAQIVHPNIVAVYEIGGRAGLQWYTMEYVRGRSLDRIVISEGRRPVDEVLRLLDEALDALALAHERGVVHRDLKPENLLIEDATGAVRIADFGLAVALGGPERTTGSGGRSGRSGTPAFAAPEQMLGEPVDHRADLYSLAVTAMYALTGVLPFGGGNVEMVVARQAAGELPKVAEFRDDVPSGILRVLERAAARTPDDRFDSAGDFADALTEAAARSGGLWGRWFRDKRGGRS